MNFDVISLILICGLLGPLLAGVKRLNIPLVVGQILAGVIIGKSGFGLVNPSDPVLTAFSAIGFAMLMFVVGTHLPLHDPNLKKALGRGLMATVLGFALAVPAGLLVAHVSGIAHPAIFILLFANCSAAVMMPMVHERKLDGPTVLFTTTWVALADAITIIALPLALSPGQTVTIATGAGITIAAATVAYFALNFFYNKTAVGDYYRSLSKERAWGFDLTIALSLLFGLCAIATHFGTSDLVAGFSSGIVIMLVGEPKRFTKQLVGIAQASFVLIFFVLLGAKLDVTALITSPQNLELTAMIVVGAFVVHGLAGKLVGLPLVSGMAASAQLGLPAAVTSLGMASGMITSGQGAAIIAAAMLSLITCSIGTAGLQKYSTPAARGTPDDADGAGKGSGRLELGEGLVDKKDKK